MFVNDYLIRKKSLFYVGMSQKYTFYFIFKAKLKVERPRKVVHRLFVAAQALIDHLARVTGIDIKKEVLLPRLEPEAVDFPEKLIDEDDKRLWHSLGDVWEFPM